MVLLPWMVVAVAFYLHWPILAPALSSAAAVLPALMRARRPNSPGGGGTGAAAAVSLSGAGGDAVLRILGGGSGGCGVNGGGELFPRNFISISLAAGYGCVVVIVITTILIVPSEVSVGVGYVSGS